MGHKAERGFGVVEMLVTVSIIGILLLISGANLRIFKEEARNGRAQLVGFLKNVRSKAIATTSSYQVSAASATQIITKYGASCDADTPYVDSQLALDLPDGAVLTNTDWTVCFTPRGISESNTSIELIDSDNRSKSIEVMLGGAVREVDNVY